LSQRALSIAYLSNNAEIIGGGERSLLEMMLWLPPDAVMPTLVLPRKGELARNARVIDVPVELLPMPSLWSPASVAALWRWRRFWREHHFDLVHANGARAAFYALVSGAPPVIFHARVAQRDRLDRFLLRRAAAIVCNSHATAKARYPEGHPKVRVIYNGIAPPELPAGIEREPLLLWVGRLDAIKRPRLAVELFERVVDLGADRRLRLAIIGGASPYGDEDIRLRKRIARSPLASRIELVGPVHDLAPWWARAKALLVTSQHEGFGRTVVEAMASGVVPVALATGALPEIVEDGRSGLLASNLADLAEKLVQALGDPKRWQAMQQAARVRAEAFSPEKMVHALLALYRELAGGMPGTETRPAKASKRGA